MGGEIHSTTDDGWIMTQLQTINDKFDIEGKYESLKEFTTQHPVYMLFIAATIATCCIPVVCFFMFLLGSVIFGVTTLVFFEGTILMISTVVLGGILCVTTVLACSLSGFVVVSYYGVHFSFNFLKQTFPSLFETPNNPDATRK